MTPLEKNIGTLLLRWAKFGGGGATVSKIGGTFKGGKNQGVFMVRYRSGHLKMWVTFRGSLKWGVVFRGSLK